MKNLLFGLIAIVTFIFNGIAQEKSDTIQKVEFKNASLITTCEKEITEYKFLSLTELNEEVDQIIQELDLRNFPKTKQNVCELIVEIKVEVAIGVAKGLMSGLITVNCVDSETVAKRLKEMILAAVMG
jgi:hypothetical protein